MARVSVPIGSVLDPALHFERDKASETPYEGGVRTGERVWIADTDLGEYLVVGSSFDGFEVHIDFGPEKTPGNRVHIGGADTSREAKALARAHWELVRHGALGLAAG